MTPEEFKLFVDERLKSCLDKLHGGKAAEYSRNNDRLHNFKRAGEMSNCIPERALWGMLVKQLVSIVDMIDDLGPVAARRDGRFVLIPSSEMTTEKFDDAINYFLLLNALIHERQILNRLTKVIKGY